MLDLIIGGAIIWGLKRLIEGPPEDEQNNRQNQRNVQNNANNQVRRPQQNSSQQRQGRPIPPNRNPYN